MLSFDDNGNPAKIDPAGNVQPPLRYHENLIVAARVAREFNVPLWNHICCDNGGAVELLARSNRTKDLRALIRYLVYTSVAYGVQALQYWRYGSYVNAVEPELQDRPDRDRIGPVGAVNWTMHRLAHFFRRMQLESSQSFLGSQPQNFPPGAPVLRPPLEKIDIAGSAGYFHLSQFNNSVDAKSRHFMMLINLDLRDAVDLRIWFDGTQQVQQVEKNNASLTTIQSESLDIQTLEPGDFVMLTYKTMPSHWALQQINLGGMTSGPAATGDPFVVVYNNELHVVYRGAAGAIVDSLFAGGAWHLQQINLGGMTSGPAATGDPFVVVYNNELHVVYRGAAGAIVDSLFAGGAWHLQQINLGGMTSGPAATGDPFVVVYGNKLHVAYRDAAGAIVDSLFAGGAWHMQQINLGGMTSGPAATGDPFVVVYGNEFHAVYRNSAGIIVDSVYH